MDISIVQVSFAMSARKKRAFGFHHGLHTSFLQVEMDGICGERLDDNSRYVSSGFVCFTKFAVWQSFQIFDTAS